MRIAVSGSHSTGKSTLIAAFLEKCPQYLHEPEAFETLGDDIELTESGEPTPEGLRALLEYTISAVESHALGSCVVFERSPVDYLAYAAASRGGEWRKAAGDFLSAHLPKVRAAIQHLDLIAYLPCVPGGPVPPDQDTAFRRRVDECLRRALLDDEYDLFGDRRAPSVVELPPRTETRLAELVRRAEAFPRLERPFNDRRLALYLSSDANAFPFAEFAQALVDERQGAIKQKLGAIGMDEVYLDLVVGGQVLTLHRQHYLGVYLCASDDVTEALLRDLVPFARRYLRELEDAGR